MLSWSSSFSPGLPAAGHRAAGPGAVAGRAQRCTVAPFSRRLIAPSASWPGKAPGHHAPGKIVLFFPFRRSRRRRIYDFFPVFRRVDPYPLLKKLSCAKLVALACISDGRGRPPCRKARHRGRPCAALYCGPLLPEVDRALRIVAGKSARPPCSGQAALSFFHRYRVEVVCDPVSCLL